MSKPIAYMHKWPNGKAALTRTEKPPGGFDGWAAVTTPLYAAPPSAVASAGRWYAIDFEGMATLCADEADARKNAKEAAEQFPRRAPYVAAQLVALPAGWKMTPIRSTEEMFCGLARDIVMWTRFPAPHYGSKLHRHLEMAGTDIPAWLHEIIPNIDHSPPKSAVADAIYRAMLEAAPEPLR